MLGGRLLVLAVASSIALLGLILLWLIVACDLTVQNADLLVISSDLGPAEVGMYFAAAKTMSLLLFISYAVASAMANRIAALDARGEQDGLRAAVTDAANWIFWPSLLAAAILAIGKTMLWLFDPQFQQAYPVMLILAVGLLLRAALGPADLVLNMLGQGAASARLLICSALLSAALSATWSPSLAWPGRRLWLGRGGDGNEPCPRCRSGRQLRARQTPARAQNGDLA